MSLLHRAFDPAEFRREAHRLADVLADALEESLGASGPVLPWREPAVETAHWAARMEAGTAPPADFLEEVIAHSIRLHHPHYVGHQVCAPAPASALASFVSGLLNNGMAIYEMGPAATALERWLIRLTCDKIGFAAGDGILTSGGTLAMLTALLAAREAMTERGAADDNLAVLASEESHYCVGRAVQVMGWGKDGLVAVPSDECFRMRTELLDSLFEDACRRGRRPIAVVGCACSTSTGSYDNLQEIAAFCRRRGLWFHADGAHGAAVAFAPALRGKIAGIELADSAMLDYHKMLLAPALTTAVLFRERKNSWAAFHDRAQYLWDEKSPEEWHNTGRRTFECTKLMMALKFATTWKAHGPGLFEEFLETVHRLAQDFTALLRSRPPFEVAVEPESNIVCFRYAPTGWDAAKTDAANAGIRRRLVHGGRFYLVQTVLRGRTWLRTALMNPFTTLEHIGALLDAIVREAAAEG